MTERPRIGLVGVGKMGRALATRLLSCGVEVFGCDPAAQNPPDGLQFVATPRQLADCCDVVMGCVSGQEAFREVTLGPNGIRGGTRVHTYANVGTTGPSLVKEIAHGLAEVDIRTIDVPMTGGPRRAARGEVTVIASGPLKVLQAVSPTLEKYSSKIVYVGPGVGQAQYVKVINNLVTAGNLAVAIEALTLAKKATISRELLLEVINSGSAASDVSTSKIPSHVLTRTFDFGASLALVDHDLSCCLHEARLIDCEMRVSKAVLDVYRSAIEAGSALDDITTLAVYLENR
ncbi:3-hydroxyisobutyrate dehydrogenase (plasmid) [Allorhizobium ampelinum S4]|uniref:3-hydroxyisobutyrate dehydrogenase n=1 Tax=Allorhizobium ampelinum (strain ATCC BAA-846 / DSM 112012 / S4) TaxID=311402 RepID=B9K381_ALLAM|nr:3-hydroxyisobutyrate dehydrogenase [Allorhizobium ampelinum S4]